jgi:hypothetical protein
MFMDKKKGFTFALALACIPVIAFAGPQSNSKWWDSQSQSAQSQSQAQTGQLLTEAERQARQAACNGSSSDAQRPECRSDYNSGSHRSYSHHEQEQGGWFIGAGYAQANTVHYAGYSITSDLTTLKFGYRWSVSPSSAVGIEVGGGNTNYGGDLVVGNAAHAYLGVNSRANFGESPAFVLFRAGTYAEATTINGVKVTSGSIPYAGIGIGADLNRNFNIQATYLRLFSNGVSASRNATEIGLEYRF